MEAPFTRKLENNSEHGAITQDTSARSQPPSHPIESDEVCHPCKTHSSPASVCHGRLVSEEACKGCKQLPAGALAVLPCSCAGLRMGGQYVVP